MFWNKWIENKFAIVVTVILDNVHHIELNKKPTTFQRQIQLLELLQDVCCETLDTIQNFSYVSDSHQKLCCRYS